MQMCFVAKEYYVKKNPVKMKHTTPINLFTTDLIYVAEGNANIVLKLPEHKKVLRLPKTENNDKTNKYSNGIEVQKHRSYMVLAMKLLGEKYFYSPEIIEIHLEEKSRINNFLADFRPEARLHRNFHGNYGLLLPDATHLNNESESHADTYSLEIKPKQGWMFDESTSSIFDLKGLKKCRYCCMQYLKLKNKKISSRSKYCPMNLFSGNANKMRKAIEALLEEPQNNLRLFKNGELIYGEFVQDKSACDSLFQFIGERNFFNLVICCLLGKKSDSEIIDEAESQTDLHCNTESNLPPSSILQNILNLQLLTKSNLDRLSQQELSETKSYEALNNIILHSKSIALINLKPEEQYMIGATFLDASLMITFQRANFDRADGIADNIELKIIAENHFLTRVLMLDLDPKPDNHFRKFLKQTNDAFAATTEHEKV